MQDIQVQFVGKNMEKPCVLGSEKDALPFFWWIVWKWWIECGDGDGIYITKNLMLILFDNGRFCSCTYSNHGLFDGDIWPSRRMTSDVVALTTCLPDISQLFTMSCHDLPWLRFTMDLPWFYHGFPMVFPWISSHVRPISTTIYHTHRGGVVNDALFQVKVLQQELADQSERHGKELKRRSLWRIPVGIHGMIYELNIWWLVIGDWWWWWWWWWWW